MDWFKKHADAVMVLAALFGGFIWIDGKFDKINDRFEKVHERLTILEKEVSNIRTIMNFSGIRTPEVAIHEAPKQ